PFEILQKTVGDAKNTSVDILLRAEGGRLPFARDRQGCGSMTPPSYPTMPDEPLQNNLTGTYYARAKFSAGGIKNEPRSTPRTRRLNSEHSVFSVVRKNFAYFFAVIVVVAVARLGEVAVSLMSPLWPSLARTTTSARPLNALLSLLFCSG